VWNPAGSDPAGVSDPVITDSAKYHNPSGSDFLGLPCKNKSDAKSPPLMVKTSILTSVLK
jgi:hypothetical protein